MSAAPPAAHRFPCAGCGADCEFDPRSGGLTCPYCGRREAIPQSAEEVVEKSYEEYLHARPEQMVVLAEGALESACEGCGARITFKPPEVSTSCPFCGRNRVSQAKSADPIVAPQGVLPFALTREQARESVRRWLGGLWFAPRALKAMAQHQGVNGIYLPFWTFDSHTTSFYQGQRGTHYYETQAYTENGETRTRQVQRTRWSAVSGNVALWHDDVTVPATTSVSTNRLDGLAPWDFGRLTAYEPAYLAGFAAQRYQVDLAAGFERAKAIMEDRVREAARQDIGGDEQRVDSVTTSYSGITFKHLLLPVYVGAYSFASRIYQVVVNARSGQVQGDRPYSAWKIAGAVLLALIVLLVLIWLTRN
jgi:DNA-directed RNA polymerase subunit RPC12/RpoP